MSINFQAFWRAINRWPKNTQRANILLSVRVHWYHLQIRTVLIAKSTLNVFLLGIAVFFFCYIWTALIHSNGGRPLLHKVMTQWDRMPTIFMLMHTLRPSNLKHTHKHHKQHYHMAQDNHRTFEFREYLPAVETHAKWNVHFKACSLFSHCPNKIFSWQINKQVNVQTIYYL